MATAWTVAPKITDLPPDNGSHRLFFFTELLRRPVCAGKITDRLGRLDDLAFALKEPYPEAAGIHLEHGWDRPTEFIPWERVLRVEDDAIFVMPPEGGRSYPPFADRPGWILLGRHLLGRTILDMDGRCSEVVNDVQLVEAKERLLLVHVDTSFNGFLRRWGLGRLHWMKDELISWKYVQPLSVEDALTTDKVSLSVTRRQLKELPCEDLADALEELTGSPQQALFSALDSEKAADTLMAAEPGARRQLVTNLRQEHARQILDEMSTLQLASLFSMLPPGDTVELLGLLSPERAQRLRVILAQREARARDIMDADFLTFSPDETVGEVLQSIRRSGRDRQCISYLYVVGEDGRSLLGVVDLRKLVVARDGQRLGEMMASPVVAAEVDDMQGDVAAIFAKYQYRMLPVVDGEDRILGVIRYKGRVNPLLR